MSSGSGSSSFVPRTPQDLLVPPTPAASHGPLTFRLPASAFLAPIPGGRSSSKSKKSKNKKRKFDDVDGVQQGQSPAKALKRKPLRSLLPSIISRIKKKDDYAFFLRPVDPALAPGYKDIVKTPMDFGTMSKKVERGKYKTLDDFTKDFNLVIDNAKLYNPAGSIYVTEAERIYAFGIDAINKAALQLDFSEPGQDAENVDGAESQSHSDTDVSEVAAPAPATPAPVASTSATPAPIVNARRNRGGDPTDISTLPDAVLAAAGGATGTLRRLRVRAHALKETKIEDDFGLPGSNDGIGAFPHGHGAAELLLQWKIRGRKMTKKERLKMEKEGPPLLRDCSLDVSRLENPFEKLSVFQHPDYTARPTVTPLIPALSAPTGENEDKIIILPPPISMRIVDPIHERLKTTKVKAEAPLPAASAPKVLKHWSRHASKQKFQGREDSSAPGQDAWGPPREVLSTDWGVYALLDAIISSSDTSTLTQNFQTDRALFEYIQSDIFTAPERALAEDATSTPTPVLDKEWPRDDVPMQERILRESVYGGVEGLAYVSSVARFVQGAEDARRQFLRDEASHSGDILAKEEQLDEAALDGDVPMSNDNDTDEKEQKPSTKGKWRQGALEAGSLAEYVEREIIDPLTDGAHSRLRAVGRHLCLGEENDAARAALEDAPRRRARRREAERLSGEKIDISAVLLAPAELYEAEKGWKTLIVKHEAERKQRRLEEAARNAAAVKSEPMDVDNDAGGSSSLSYALKASQAAVAQFVETQANAEKEPTLVEFALQRTAAQLDGLATASAWLADIVEADVDDKKPGAVRPEDEETHALRLQLLALAKRAPIRMIEAVPAQLVPPHVRYAFSGLIKTQANLASASTLPSLGGGT